MFWRKGLLERFVLIIKDGDTPIVPVMLFNAKLSQDMARELFARASTRSGSSSRWWARARLGFGRSSRPVMISIIWKRRWRPLPRWATSTAILGKGKKEIKEMYGL